HVLVVLAPRFERTFWKYRNHSKAYRVCILDVGHLSQTLLLSATEQGLGSFVTAAINEGDIEKSLGLTGVAESPLAVCGFGIRADKITTIELEPNLKVRPRWNALTRNPTLPHPGEAQSDLAHPVHVHLAHLQQRAAEGEA